MSPVHHSSTDREDNGLQYVIMDVFTREKFKGNPLAVVFEDTEGNPLSGVEKQTIAKEFNLSETVFVGKREADDTNDKFWPLTIMTPMEELPFAGHPVVGAACALSVGGGLVANGSFETKAGPIRFSVGPSAESSSHSTACAEISVPFDVHLHKTVANLTDIGQQGLSTSRNDFPFFSITKGMTYILVEVSSFAALNQVSLSRKKLDVELDKDWSPSFVGTYFFYRAPHSGTGEPIELHTRMIEPDLGEDPVTGSAASALTAYLTLEAAKEVSSQRKFEYRVTQGEYMGRKGTPTVIVALDESKAISSMTLKGDAVRVMTGAIER